MSALWATFRGLPVLGQVGALLALIGLLAGLWLYFDRKDARRIEKVEAGAVNKERAATAVETVKKVEKANEARNNVRERDDAWHAECLRHARNPADCG